MSPSATRTVSAEPQVFDDIVEQAPDQEFQGQIIDALGAPGLACPVGSEPAMDDPVAQRERGRDKPVAIGRRRRVLADGQGQFGENRGLEFIDVRLARRHVANRRWHSRLRQILLPHVHRHRNRACGSVYCEGDGRPAHPRRSEPTVTPAVPACATHVPNPAGPQDAAGGVAFRGAAAYNCQRNTIDCLRGENANAIPKNFRRLPSRSPLAAAGSVRLRGEARC